MSGGPADAFSGHKNGNQFVIDSILFKCESSTKPRPQTAFVSQDAGSREKKTSPLPNLNPLCSSCLKNNNITNADEKSCSTLTGFIGDMIQQTAEKMSLVHYIINGDNNPSIKEMSVCLYPSCWTANPHPGWSNADGEDIYLF